MMKSDELRMEMLASVAVTGLVRTMVEQRLITWGLADLVPDTVLVAAELVTNAVEASPTGAVIQVRMSRGMDHVLLQVWDPVDALPVARQPLHGLEGDPDDNGGWGLSIVQALSTECGTERSPNGGKTVWARLKAS